MPNKLTTQSQRDILPTNVKPTHYDLVIRPDLKKFEFTGNVSIKINILQPTKQIKLNGKEIVINSAVIDGPEKQFFSEVGYDEEKEEITLSFPKELPPSTTALLAIEFTGIINDKLVGFYRSSFDDPNNNKSYLAVTHFEPTDARRVFPCWDEPNLKATFDITMIVDPELTALSNMHAVTEKVESGKKHIKFATSPVMSTYLVAFAVGPLEYVESKNQNGTLVRVYTTPGISYQGRFALDCACRTLDFFTEYFGIPYPMQKMDMIAIPDFSMGAMENWGLVTYRTTALLFDPKQSTTKTKQRIAYVVGHELAHQWFGNLVTMDWWTDLWLNEGFATWAGTLATDFLFPEWKIWTEFIVDDLMRGLQLDSLRSSHPIEVDVKNPAEINQIFDAISYSKGASVIRMLVSYLGEETFKLGIRKYLKRFEFRNATTKDLWEALEEQSKKPVKEMMTSWTRHIGYPIVKVERESCCCLRMTQNRYLSTGDVAEQENSTLWQIPLGLVVEGNAQPNAEELSTKSKSVEIGKDRFIKINKNSCGFFRTFYEKELMQNIGKAILDGKLPPEDRIGIINDAFNLAYSGHHDATVPLGLMQNFSNESNYMVWLELSSRLSELKSVWWEQDEQVQEGLKELICELCDGQVKSLGFDYRAGEDDIVGLLRVLILAMASRNNHQGVIEECKKRFSSFSNGNENAIHPDLRGIVFASVVKYGDVEEFDKVLEIYRQTKTVDQKLAALRALSFSQNSKLNTRFIEMSLNGEVRNQDVAFVIAYASSNFKSRRPTWEFVKNNWTKFYDTFYAGSSVLLGRVVSYSTENFTTEKDSAAVKQFFMDKNVTAIDRSIQQSIEKINCASNLLKRDSKPVAQWVLAHVKSRKQKS